MEVLGQNQRKEKAMWDWVEKNREWAFSGIGITMILFLIWLFRAGIAKVYGFFFTQEKPEVVIRLRGAIAQHAIFGSVDALSITAENHSDKDIIIGNFLLLTKEKRIYVQIDGLTGVPQHRQTLRAGDSCSFHITASQLKEINLPPAAYVGASVETPLNKEFRSSHKDLNGLRSLIAGVLK
jgi:hypothetical protein